MKDLDSKRQEYLSRMSELKLDEQYTSLTQQMEEVSKLEQAIDRRLQQCAEQQQEVGIHIHNKIISGNNRGKRGKRQKINKMTISVM